MGVRFQLPILVIMIVSVRMCVTRQAMSRD